MIGLDKVSVTLSAELGGRMFPLGEVLGFGRGAVIEMETPGPQIVTLRAGRVAVAEGRLIPGADGALRVEVTWLLTRRATDSPLAA